MKLIKLLAIYLIRLFCFTVLAILIFYAISVSLLFFIRFLSDIDNRNIRQLFSPIEYILYDPPPCMPTAYPDASGEWVYSSCSSKPVFFNLPFLVVLFILSLLLSYYLIRKLLKKDANISQSNKHVLTREIQFSLVIPHIIISSLAVLVALLSNQLSSQFCSQKMLYGETSTFCLKTTSFFSQPFNMFFTMILSAIFFYGMYYLLKYIVKK